jgi:hypothetical protein
MRYALAFAVACVGLGGSISVAAAQPHHDILVGGTLTTQVVPCASLCTESEWDGRLDGTSEFSLISLEDAGIPNQNISRFHGNLMLSTADGDLIGTDLGLWNLDTGKYVDVYTVTSGTDAYEGATAVILLFGTLDPTTGQGLSRYEGVVEVPHHH